MDRLITCIRVFAGIVAVLLLVAFWVLICLLKLIAGAISLPLAAVSKTRKEIKESWLGRRPFLPWRNIKRDAEKIWVWTFAG